MVFFQKMASKSPIFIIFSYQKICEDFTMKMSQYILSHITCHSSLQATPIRSRCSITPQRFDSQPVMDSGLVDMPGYTEIPANTRKVFCTI